MRALVVGGGLVGSTLAARLARDRHDVVVIEESRAQLEAISEHLDVQVLAGNGTTVEVLRRAGIETCDALFACTSSDEANMVVALIASAIFRVPRVVARLRESDHEASFRAIAQRIPGEHVCINPDGAAAERILSLLPVPGAADVVSFLDGRLFLAGFPIAATSHFAGLRLSHLKLLFPAPPVLAVAIRRGERWFVPHGEDEFRAGDLAYLAVDPTEVDNVLKLLGVERGEEERVMIAGATRIGLEVARRLDARGVPVTLVEEQAQACQHAAAALDNAVVLRGTPTDGDLLEEEGVSRVAAFLACSDNHHVNVVSCLLARHLGARRTLALVDNAALAAMVGGLGIDAVISPRLLTVGLAVQFVRRGKVRAAAALMEDVVEMVEVDVLSGSRLTRAPLAELGLPRGCLVAAALRREKLIVPSGQDRLEAGDRALVITTSERAPDLDAFLGG